MKNVRESVDDEFIDPMVILFERMVERTLLEKFADAKFTDLASNVSDLGGNGACTITRYTSTLSRAIGYRSIYLDPI